MNAINVLWCERICTVHPLIWGKRMVQLLLQLGCQWLEKNNKFSPGAVSNGGLGRICVKTHHNINSLAIVHEIMTGCGIVDMMIHNEE